MPSRSVHDEALNSYLLYMFTCNLFLPPKELKEFCLLFGLNVACLLAIEQTHYINGREPIPKARNLHLVWQYAQNLATHHRFVSMLHVTPLVFHTILTLIQDHPVFTNHSNNSQTPVEKQLAVMLYRMGCFGNGISVEDQMPSQRVIVLRPWQFRNGGFVGVLLALWHCKGVKDRVLRSNDSG